MFKRNERGFTLMELMVVIVIVAILAAVAVPLYINYVKDAQRTEAKGAIGAIVTAEQVYFQKFATYRNYSDTQFTTPPASTATDGPLDCDVTEAQRNWAFVVSAADDETFTVEATGKASAVNLGVKLVYDRTAAPIWTEN